MRAPVLRQAQSGGSPTASTSSGPSTAERSGMIPTATLRQAQGGLTVDPWLNHSFSYDAENRMTAGSWLTATAGFTYDPLSRLDTYNPSSGAFRRFVYDGDEVAAELDSSGNIVSRYIRGDAPDEMLLDYSGAGSTAYDYHHLDERMSAIAWSDPTGALAAISHYDEFGIPAATNPGRFQYTGQMWLSEISEYYYKTRGYSANMGRFLQTDPTGYSAGPNLYEYVGSDPMNFVDPLGLCQYPGDRYRHSNSVRNYHFLSALGFRIRWRITRWRGRDRCRRRRAWWRHWSGRR